MEGHSTRVCEHCGMLYPPDVEWCPADGEPTVAAMLVRAAPSGSQTPRAPTRLANNFRPSLSKSLTMPARFTAHLPERDFVEDPQLPPEEETSVRISIPQQPKAVYSENSLYFKAPVLTALREMRSFAEEELKTTQHQRPSQDAALDDESVTKAQPKRDDGEGRSRNRFVSRPPQRAPTPALQGQRRPKLTMLEVEPAKAPTQTPRPMPLVIREASPTQIAINPEKIQHEPETSIAIPIEPKTAPFKEFTQEEKQEAPLLSISAVPLAYEEPPRSLFMRLREWCSDVFVPWLTELKESAILRLIALVAFLIIVSKGLLSLVQLFGV
jgi:hypothetical protein